MELTMSSAIWNVFLDISIMAVFLMIAKLMRTKIKIIQKLDTTSIVSRIYGSCLRT